MKTSSAYPAAVMPPLLQAPTRRFAILTCLDAYLNPARLLGLEADVVHLVRSPGGRATDAAIAALLASHAQLGTREWFIIRHTGCNLALPSGRQASYSELLTSVVDDVARLRQHPQVPAAVPIYGYVCDTKTQHLVEVPAATRLGQPSF